MTTPNAIVGLICGQWQRTIAEIEDAQIDEPSALILINGTRQTLLESGITPIEAHYLLALLRDMLPALTGGHPICKQFIELLNRQLELEFN